MKFNEHLSIAMWIDYSEYLVNGCKWAVAAMIPWARFTLPCNFIHTAKVPSAYPWAGPPGFLPNWFYGCV